MKLLQLIKDLHTYALWFLNTYPVIKGKDSLCTYYRKKNKEVPLTYTLHVSGVIVITLLKLFWLVFVGTDSFVRVRDDALEALVLYIICIPSALYFWKLKKIAEIRSNLKNYEIQAQIYAKLRACPLIAFVIGIAILAHVVFGDVEFPLSLGWLISFLSTLISCVLYLDNVWIKLANIFSYNFAFCLASAYKSEDFRQSFAERILVPSVLSFFFIVVHDRNVKSNFILKRLLKQQKSMYESFLKKLQDPVMIVNEKSLVFTNSATNHVFGHTLDTFYKKASNLISYDGIMLSDYVKQRLAQNETYDDPIQQEKHYFTLKGDKLDENHKTFVVSLIESGYFYGVKTIGIISRDITSELIQQEKRLEDRFKNMMLYSLSHELRTPLNILQDVLFMVKHLKINSSEKERYKNGKGAWNYLRIKINDTLAYSQLLTGEFELHETKFSLAAFVSYMMKMTSFLLQKKRENIKLSFHIDEGLNDMVRGDGERLEQVLFNLLQNAVKYTETGSISLSVYPKEGLRTVYEVSDTGCGISESMANTMFHESNQTRSESFSDYYSMLVETCGLGLTVSSMICRKMGGSISVTSVPNKGSTFRVVLPLMLHNIRTSGLSIPRDNCTSPGLGGLCEVPDEEECKANSCNRSQSPFSKCAPDPKVGKKVVALIVDDNAFNRFAAKALISHYCSRIEEAENGLVAIEKFQGLQRAFPNQRILILMDLEMPLMNGIDACKRIRELPNEPQPYIAALTALASESERKKCIKAGMDQFLNKPLTKQTLKIMMSSLDIDI